MVGAPIEASLITAMVCTSERGPGRVKLSVLQLQPALLKSQQKESWSGSWQSRSGVNVFSFAKVGQSNDNRQTDRVHW